MVPTVTGVVVEFFQTTGYELAGFEETAAAICGFHGFSLEICWIESKEKPPRERAVNCCKLDRNCRDSPETRKPPSGGYLRTCMTGFLVLPRTQPLVINVASSTVTPHASHVRESCHAPTSLASPSCRALSVKWQ
jgi:hypothetical protein